MAYEINDFGINLLVNLDQVFTVKKATESKQLLFTSAGGEVAKALFPNQAARDAAYDELKAGSDHPGNGPKLPAPPP